MSAPIPTTSAPGDGSATTADAATDPTNAAVTSPTTDTSGSSTTTATDTTAAAAASSAQAAATPTPSSPTNTAAAAAAATVAAIQDVMGDQDADDMTRLRAAEVMVDALDNSSFTGLLQAADQQAVAMSSSSGGSS